MRWQAETDVVVVGAGGCGLAAALAAQAAGAEVVVLEKERRPGGNTALSTGSVPGAGTRFQRQAGIEDSPDRFEADLLRQSGLSDDAFLTRLLAAESASLVEWLVDEAGVHLELITDYRHVGHSVPRLHAPRSRQGKDLMADLLAAAERRAIPIAVGTPVVRLVQDDRGVAGVVTRGEDGVQEAIRARAVILAANGFGASRPLLREFCPEVAEAPYFGALGNTGEAIQWCRDLGAELANMGAYQGYAAVAYPHGTLLSWTVIEKGGVLVNRQGRRFGDESRGYSGFAASVLAQPDNLAYAVFDQRIRDYVAAHEQEFRELVAAGAVRLAPDLDALAQVYGLPPAALRASVEEYARAARGDGPDAFGRTDFGFAPLEPPFALCQVTAGLFHTQGGVRVDASARVLDREGRPIPGLYAGGGVAMGISGRKGGAGYSSGSGLLSALGLGRIAGRHAGAQVTGRGEGAE
ncbi:MAG: FAD-dependent oxidoreductase [Firmicutes bacterium]|nr:FAD-dependent oxidoreductase [Bacillota bacterium]